MKTNFLVPILLLCLAVVGSYAQVVDKDPCAEVAQLRRVLARAMDTAVIHKGKIRSLKLNLPNDRERLLLFEHLEDGKSFTVVDEGRKIVVFFDELRRISEILLPDGKRARFEWAMAPSGHWIPSAIKVDGKSLGRTAGLVEGDCSLPCENAAIMAAIAAATCAASGPLSYDCFIDTMWAVLGAYYCHRCLHPEAEAPPDN